MEKTLVMIAAAILLSASVCHAKEIAGVEMPDSFSSGDINLVLNGAGVRKKFFIKLYVGGLYLLRKGQDPASIMQADEPMAIKLHVISSLISAKQMKRATREGFVKATKGKIDPIKAQIDKLIEIFKDGIKKNDVYDLVFIPGKGLEAFKNNKPRARIKGLPFKQALFGIWLCDDPVQEGLKQGMLGQ